MVRQHQKGCISPHPPERLACFPSGEARFEGFYNTGGEAAHLNPLNLLNQPATGGPNPLNPLAIGNTSAPPTGI